LVAPTTRVAAACSPALPRPAHHAGGGLPDPSVAGGAGSGQTAGALSLPANTARQAHRAHWHGICLHLEARQHDGPGTGGPQGGGHRGSVGAMRMRGAMGSTPGAGLPHGFPWLTFSRGENHDTQYANTSKTASKPPRCTRLCSSTVLAILGLRVRVGLWGRASLPTLRVVPASRSATSDACPGCARASPSSCLHVSRLPVRGDASETAGKGVRRSCRMSATRSSGGGLVTPIVSSRVGRLRCRS
jgi:hypothetical protein